MSIGKNIRRLRELKHLSQEEFGKIAGVSSKAVSTWENDIKVPRMGAIQKIADYFGIKKSDIIEDIEPSNIEVLPKSEIRMIPLFENVSAGFGAYASDEIIDYVPLFIENDYEAENTLCIKVKGDSMFPKIENGDIVQVLKQDMVDSGQIAVVLIDGEEGLVKKVIIEKDYIELISLNPEYQPKKFEKEDMNRVSIIGLVKRIIKEC